MNREQEELSRQLESSRKELARLLANENGDNLLRKDASKEEDRIRDEIADLIRRLKIIEKHEKKS